MQKRTLLTILSLLLLSFTNGYSQLWEAQANNVLPIGSSGNDYEISDISIVNDQVIWASAIDWISIEACVEVAPDHIPVILKSTNGGMDWDSMYVEEAIGRNILDIHAIDEDHAWITTNNMASSSGRGLFFTANGGANWSPNLNGDVGGSWLHFFDSMNGVCGNRSEVKFTDNGGENWYDANSPLFESEENNINYSSASYITTVGETIWYGTSNPNGGRVFRSTNKGQDWNAYEIENNTESCYSIAFINETEGLMTTEDSPRRSTDGGETWMPISCPYDIYELANVPNSGIIVGTSYEFNGLGSNQTICTDDLGETWIRLDSSAAVFAPKFKDIDHGWAGGLRPSSDSSALYKLNGMLPHMVNSVNNLLDKATQIKVFPNPFTTHVKIEAEVHVKTIRLLDIDGKLHREFTSQNTSESTLNLSHLNPGIYFLEIRTQEGFITKKIVKK